MKNKKKLIIIIAAAAAAVIAAIITIVAVNSNKGCDNCKDQETTVAATAASEPVPATAASEPVAETTQSVEKTLPDTPPETEELIGTEEPETLPAIDIALPTEGGEVTYFSAEFFPDTSAEDIAKGTKVSIRSLFGQGNADGKLTFNSDGTFTDSLSSSGMASGAYHAENRKITAVYLPDRQMDIHIIEWDDQNNKPFSFYVIYSMGENANYKVYFTEKK